MSGMMRYLPILFLLLFFILPIVLWVIKYKSTFTVDFILDPPFPRQLATTYLLSLITSVASVVIAYPLALTWWVKKRNYFSKVVLALVFVPFALGLITRNYTWMSILSYTDIGYSFNAVIIVMVYIFIPFAFFILIQGFTTIPSSNLEAAKIMGANLFESFRKIILPQTQRQVLISGFLVFTNSLCYYITPAMIGGGNYDMTGNVIWQHVDRGLFTEASGISIAFVVYMIPVFIFALYFIIKRKKRAS